jgi:hypothetical protein
LNAAVPGSFSAQKLWLSTRALLAPQSMIASVLAQLALRKVTPLARPRWVAWVLAMKPATAVAWSAPAAPALQ